MAKRIQVSRGIVREEEARPARQRELGGEALAERRSTDGLPAGFLIREAADRYASQATASVLAPDGNVEVLDTLAKAMRSLAGR